MNIEAERRNAQAIIWAAAHHYSEYQMEQAWKHALRDGSAIVRRYSEHGHSWVDLTPGQLQQLVERYSR